MSLSIPSALESLAMAGRASKALAAWRRKSTGDSRALLDELENNLRYLDLVADDDAALSDVVGDLSVSEFDRLMAAGFNFNALKRRKIAAMPSLEGTDLASWQGRETQALVFSIYAKIKDVRVKFPHARTSPNYRWGARIQNIRKRIWLLIRHMNA